MISALVASIVIATNAVTFTAKATGISTGVQLEFLFVDPTSDREYEALFVTDDPLAEIVAAFRKAGIEKGSPVDAKGCCFWPCGPKLTMEPAFEELAKDTEGKGTLPVVFTGGNGSGDIPAAIFALYSFAGSPLQFDDALEQSTAYGRFQALKELKKGMPKRFTFRWDGQSRTTAMTPDFPPDKTVAEARAVAAGLARLDSREAKINGFKDGQFFYRAFLPLEKWRDRRERLSQPLEIRLSSTNISYTVIDEDWTVDGPDPKLTPREVTLQAAQKHPTVSALVFTRGSEKLSRLYQLKASLPNIHNWYIYAD